jgi:hypothetical protein
MPFEAHLLQMNWQKEKVEVILYSQQHPQEPRIVHVVQVNIQTLATGETASTLRKVDFVFSNYEDADTFQIAMRHAESVM